jgi:dodecin
MTHHMTTVIEIIGSSENGGEEAPQVPIDEAGKTIHAIHGVEITDMTADEITEYRAGVKISFAVEH